MTNEQKYKTAEERVKAFLDFYGEQKAETCERCMFQKDGCIGSKVSKGFLCYQNWLLIEAEGEKPKPCPFCGRSVNTFITSINGRAVHGISCFCGYRKSVPTKIKMETVIAAHNRVARAVENYKNKEK